MKTSLFQRIVLLALVWCGWVLNTTAVTPPVIRSTEYNGAHSNVVHFPLRDWMNTNTPNITVEAWIYPRDLIGHQALVARSFSTSLYFGLNGNRLRFYRSGGTQVDSTGTLTAFRWTHVAVSYDGTTARFYINGVAAGSAALSNAGNNSTNGLTLGGQREQNAAGLYAFNGYLDEVRIWSVARSQSQISANLNSELRSGTGLHFAAGSGGSPNDLTGQNGGTVGIPLSERRSGFGLLPSNLCVPFTSNALRVDANIDRLNEYRGAETIVLRSTTSATAPDQVGYLMVSTNTTNFHLYVALSALPQGTGPNPPTVQVMADVNVTDGASMALGDWECRLQEDTFQGGRIMGVNPPFFPTPTWLSWGQSTSSWQAATAVDFEFDQNYEFRIHGRHLNHFTNVVGLLVRYYDYVSGVDQLIAPRGGVTNFPATFARADWCGRADSDLFSATVSGSVTNVGSNVGVAGRSVSLYSGNSELGGYLLASTTTDAAGRFTFSNVQAPLERNLTVTYASPGGSIVALNPRMDGTPGRVGVLTINSPYSVTYPACASGCTYQSVHFQYRTLGPVSLGLVTPTTTALPVMVRASPPKYTPTNSITLSGSNLHSGVNLYFKGSGCNIDPPSFCTSDFVEAGNVSIAPDGLSLTALVPEGLANVSSGGRTFQLVVENPSFASTGGNRWNYGPSVLVTPPIWPLLHGFEFINRDDGPSVEEFEACYGDSIFNIFRIREPYYGIWALVYFAWMDGCRGSCYGMAGTSRLMADNFLPRNTYDVPGGDGVHGVRYANGYLGVTPCAISGELCPPRPYRWTGFDLFEPFRTQNLWGRITSMAGAQTSAEALGFWLSQLGRPVAFGPRRGLAAANPVDVLNRIRANPNDYTISVCTRDLGGGHCITPYGVIDNMRLDPTAVTPTPAADFSLIKVYDNNWPEEERYIEVNRTDNTFRYNSGGSAIGIYDGAGLFYVPASVYRSARHAPDPFFLGRYGLEFLRMLTVGSSSASLTDANGGRVGWSPTALSNSYEGALTYVPPAALREGVTPFDTTMLFLPASNAPVSGGFYSSGGNVMLYGGMGWGDIAFGFNAANAGTSNSVDGILIGLNQGLQALGLRTGAPVTGFGAMVASRDAAGQSRVFVLDAGAGSVTPDVHLERDGFKSLTIRNRSTSPLAFRLNLAGTDNSAGTFEYAYELYSLPGQATLTLRLPENPAIRTLTRELDLASDGSIDSVEEAPANGQLRISENAGVVALRWRQAGFGETLEATTALKPDEWSPVGVPVTTEGSDRVARVSPGKPAEFYRLRMTGTNCLALSAFPLGAKPNPWETNGFKFEAFNAGGAMLAQNTIASRGGYAGLDVQHTVRVHPSEDCDVLHLDVFQNSGLVTFEAVGPLGVILGRQTLSGVSASPQRVSFRAFRGRIQFVRVVSPNASCVIVNVCGERTPIPANGPTSDCASFSNATAGQFSSPYAFEMLNISSSPGPVIIGPVSGLAGNWLKLGGDVQFDLSGPTIPCNRVRLRLRDFEGVVSVKAFDALGNEVGIAGPPAGDANPQELVVNGAGIVRVVVFSTSDKAFLQEICCEKVSSP